MLPFCVVSQEMPEEMRTRLGQRFGEIISLPPDPDLAEPVQCHPDMIFAVLNGRMFVSGRYSALYPAVVGRIADLGGFGIVPTDDARNARYPHDAGFNIAVWRDCVICNPSVTSPALLDHAEQSGYRIVPVKQGYTGCSCLVTGDAVHTFDRGIVKSLRREDIPYVLLEEGGISLPGYDCGFLGGACGYHDGTIVVCGNADLLPCAAALHNAGSVFSLSDTPVTDYGGIKIYQRN